MQILTLSLFAAWGLKQVAFVDVRPSVIQAHSVRAKRGILIGTLIEALVKHFNW